MEHALGEDEIEAGGREREREDVRLDERRALDAPEPFTRSSIAAEMSTATSSPPSRCHPGVEPGARREPGAAAGVEDSLSTREVVAHRITGREPVALEDPGGDLLLHAVRAEPRPVGPLVAEALPRLVLPGAARCRETWDALSDGIGVCCAEKRPIRDFVALAHSVVECEDRAVERIKK